MEVWKRTVYICLFGAFLTSMGTSQVAPILPLYVETMGVTDQAAVAQWSGWALGITFIVVALVAPFWGKLADRKGRKLILLRASFGMMLCNLLIAFVQTPWQLVLARTAQGAVSGFFSGSVTLVSAETPEEHTGWALGMLAAANLAGALIGPLVGGYLASMFGIRSTFFIVSFFLSISFLLTLFFVHESYKPPVEKVKQSFRMLKKQLPNFHLIALMAVSTFIYAVSLLALQPIITVYVEEIIPPNTTHVALLAGIVFSATGFAQMMSSSVLGKLVDRLGPRRILFAALIYVGILTIPQAYVRDVIQLTVLRFFLGLGFGGLLPSINTFISNHAPKHLAGQVFSYVQSVQFLGYFLGSIGGASFMAACGFTTLFWATGLLFIFNGLLVYLKVRK